MRRFQILLLLSACSSGAPLTPENTRLAVDLVWSHVYQTDAPPPVPMFVVGQRCLKTAGIPETWCVDGYYQEPTDIVVVGWNGSYASSALAHEMWHYYSFLWFGDGDAQHLNRGWSSIVPDAEEAMRARGL